MVAKLPIGVLASGSGSNFQAIADACARPEFPARVAVLVTNRPDAGALARAARANVPAVAIESRGIERGEHERLVAGALDDAGVRLVCLAGYMRLLTPFFVKRFEGRLVNVHPALLPAFPGTHGPRQALAHGVRIAGCTTHFVTEDMDAGPVILQAAVPVLPEDSEDDLAARILVEEHRIYVETVRLFAEGRLRVEGRRVAIAGAAPDAQARLRWGVS